MSTKNTFRLQMGHKTTFRRTIVKGEKKASKKAKDESYQLVFEPGQDYELTDDEIAGLEKEISTGLLVPTDKDEHGRQRVKPKPPEHAAPSKGARTKKAPRAKKPAADLTTGGTPGGRKKKGVEVGAATVPAEGDHETK